MSRVCVLVILCVENTPLRPSRVFVCVFCVESQSDVSGDNSGVVEIGWVI